MLFRLPSYFRRFLVKEFPHRHAKRLREALQIRNARLSIPRLPSSYGINRYINLCGEFVLPQQAFLSQRT